MEGYIKLRKEAVDILRSRLPENICYHSVQHTLDVLAVCNKYIRRERISSHEAKLLRVAVLLHDIGYTVSSYDHERKSVEVAKELMLKYDFYRDDMDAVCGLILATRIPQKPKNDLEKILCDADLDYLGRADYYQVSDLLFKELNTLSGPMLKTDWNKAQIQFLIEHRYHTKFARKNRQPEKEKRILELQALN